MSARANTIRQRALQVIEVWLGSHREGPTAPEFREAYLDTYPGTPENSVGAVLGELVMSGDLAKCGRLRHSRYVPAGTECEYDGVDLRAAIVLDALHAAAQHHGRAVSGAEVWDIMSSADREELRSRNVLGTTLETLSFTSMTKEKRASMRWGKALAEKFRVRTTGRDRVFWAPSGSSFRPPPFGSFTDALRHAVRCAYHELGTGVKKAELRWWALANKDSADPMVEAAAEAYLRRGARTRLHQVVHIDRGTEGEGAGTVRTQQSHLGRYSRRFAATDLSRTQRVAAALEDLLLLARPADELASLAVLSRIADDTASKVAQRLISNRQGALLALFDSLDAAPREIEQAIDLVLGAQAVLERWIYQADASGAVKSRGSDLCAETARQIASVRAVMRMERPTVIRGHKTVANCPGSTLAELEPFVLEVIKVIGSTARTTKNYISNARRLSAPTGGAVAVKSKSDLYSRLDRPDTLTLLVRKIAMPRMGGLVQAAENALGFVLRDTKVALSLLAQAGHDLPVIRYGLAVGAAMMGAEVERALVVKNPGVEGDAAAYVAAVAMGVDDDDRRQSLINEAYIESTGEALKLFGAVLRRMEAGARLTVLG